jgi:hypothetical protein
MKKWNYSCLGETKLECQSFNPLVTSKLNWGGKQTETANCFCPCVFLTGLFTGIFL